VYQWSLGVAQWVCVKDCCVCVHRDADYSPLIVCFLVVDDDDDDDDVSRMGSFFLFARILFAPTLLL
jgi:hypothetical protein